VLRLAFERLHPRLVLALHRRLLGNVLS